MITTETGISPPLRPPVPIPAGMLSAKQNSQRRLPAEGAGYEGGWSIPTCGNINTGGAPKLVKVPPMEILTKIYRREGVLKVRTAPAGNMRNISAARVIAAGSVMKEPSSGPSDSQKVASAFEQAPAAPAGEPP